jgi:large subunit ribosomal protein L6
MSRVAKKPVNLPKGVELNIQPESVSVKGPKGSLSLPKVAGVEITVENGVANLAANDPSLLALTGTVRAILANMVHGVTEGFERKLELVGVGYRAAMQGKNLQLALGFSHDVVYEPPQGITIAVPKPTEIVVTGINKQQVGQVAAEIREYRGPEPYKGKGVKYAGERIVRKEGKKK